MGFVLRQFPQAYWKKSVHGSAVLSMAERSKLCGALGAVGAASEDLVPLELCATAKPAPSSSTVAIRIVCITFPCLLAVCLTQKGITEKGSGPAEKRPATGRSVSQEAGSLTANSLQSRR